MNAPISGINQKDVFDVGVKLYTAEFRRQLRALEPEALEIVGIDTERHDMVDLEVRIINSTADIYYMALFEPPTMIDSSKLKNVAGGEAMVEAVQTLGSTSTVGTAASLSCLCTCALTFGTFGSIGTAGTADVS